jgi:hypothetical protein
MLRLLLFWELTLSPTMIYRTQARNSHGINDTIHDACRENQTVSMT